MNLGSQFLFFFSLIGVFNGLLLGIYCILFNKEQHLSRYIFGALILSMCLRNLKSVMVYFEQTRDNPWLLQLGESAYFLIGPLLLIFIIANLRQLNKLEPWMRNLLVFTLAIVVVFGILFPASDEYLVWRDPVREINNYALLLYLVLSGYVLRDNLLKQFAKSYEFEKWTLIVFGANLIIGIAYAIALFSGTYSLGPLVFSIAIYAILVYFIWHFKNVNALFRMQKKYAVTIDEDEAMKMLLKLNQLVSSKRLFLNENLRIQDLAKELDIPKYQISQLLNDKSGKRFNQYINEFRVNEACLLIRQSSQFTLEGIGLEVGFKSKSTFFAAFKQMKGMTPNEFKTSS